MQSLKRALPLNLAIYGLYLLVAVVITWPLVTVISTRFAGYPFGDAHEMTRHIWWIKHALQTGQPLIFQPLLGYPDGMQGVILWSDPLQFFPGWLFAFFMPLPAAYNLFALLTLALNGWAAYWLVWKLTNTRSAALLGGLVFMTAPVIQGHLAGGHGGLLVQWPLPLLTYHLLALTGLQSSAISRQSPVTGSNPSSVLSTQYSVLSLQHSVLSTFFFVVTPFGHTLQLIYAVLPLMIVIAITVIIRRDWWALLRLVIVGVVGSILLLIFLLPVFSSTFGTSAYTAEGGGVDFSADLLGIVTPSFNHPMYGQLDYTHKVLGINIVEGSSYSGIIAGLLVLLALWKVKAARWWLILALVLWILSLGPLLKVFDQPLKINLGDYETYLTLPYALVYNLPGFSLARAPGRFDFLLALVVAVLVGYGWAWISGKFQVSSFKSNASLQSPVASPDPSSILSTTSSLSTQHSVLSTFSPLGTRYSALGTFLPSVLSTQYSVLFATVLVAMLIVLDYQSFWPLPIYDATIPQAVYDLSKRADVRAVYDVPWDNLLAAKDALWLQTAHKKPMIAGQVTRRTPVNPAKLIILEQTMNPALLKEAGVDVVIVHKFYDKDGKLAANARKNLGAPIYEDDLLALFDVHLRQGGWLIDPYVYQPVDTSPNRSDLYVYLPEGGWLTLILSQREVSPEFTLKVDGQIVRRWPTNAFSYEMPVSIPINTIKTGGYHVLTTEMSPPCPETLPTDLQCTHSPPVMIYEKGAERSFIWQFLNQPVNFDRGVQLLGNRIPSTVFNGQLPVDLWWQFDQPRTEQDIRFIKVIDATGKPVATDDHSLGVQPKGGQWVETVSLDLPHDLAAGEYKVYVGWYTYPDMTRFKVLSDVPGAQDNWAQIGTFTVAKSP